MFKSRLVTLLILVLGLFLIVNLTRSITGLLKAGDRIREEEEKLMGIKLKNEQLKKTLLQVESPEYLEKMARDKLGLAKPGEIVVILPSFPPSTTPSAANETLPNWKKWWNLFF